jgi:hypothetical protein
MVVFSASDNHPYCGYIGTDGSILCLVTIHIVVTSKQQGCIICLVTINIVVASEQMVLFSLPAIHACCG